MGFDVLASSLRADTRDLSAFTEALAVKLEGALPSQTQVERKSAGFLSKTRRVRSISVNMGNQLYQLVADGGRVQPRRCKVVRGVVLKTEEIPLEDWIDELSRDLTAAAQENEQARLALERLLE